MFDTVVFSDFDGTVTVEDTVVGSLAQALPMEKIKSVMERMRTREISIAAGVRSMFRCAPSSTYPLMERYVKNTPMFPGFAALLDFLQEKQVPFVIISGGIDTLLDCKLEPYKEKIHAVHACQLDLSQPYMDIVSEYDDGIENLKKTAIMELYPCKRSICIGDGGTDLRMAEKADVVFARDSLADHLEQENQPFYRWETFYDIIEQLKKIL